MTKAVAQKQNSPTPINLDAISRALMHGDLSRLDEAQKLSYYKNLCESVGLNPLSKPFQYMKLSGKEVLYADKGCAEQLRKLHNVSLQITDRQRFDDVYVVTAQARLPEGREDASTGAVNVAGLKGEALANAFMKAETKAKRRVTLSICGLGMLDETEVDTIPGVKKVEEVEQNVSDDPGEFALNFTRGFKGKKIKDIPTEALIGPNGLIAWCIKKNEHLDFVRAAEAYLNNLEDIVPVESGYGTPKSFEDFE